MRLRRVGSRNKRVDQRNLEYFLQQLINGLTLGGIYGLIAIGYTMVYGIIGMINFAHGEIYMIGAFIALIAFLVLGLVGVTWVPLALLIVLVVAMVLTAFYGWVLERVAYRPLRGAPRLSALISAIGMSIFLQNYVQLAQGARVKPLAPVIPGGFSLLEVDGFIVQLSYLQVIIIVLTTALMAGFSLIINRTSLGRAQRACAQDMKMASLIGIDVDRTISTTFVIGAALAAVAGMMVTLYYGVIDFYIGFLAGIKAFTAAVLGGIGSLPGAMLGGVLIGLIEVFWSAYFTIEYKDVAAFSILVLVLIFRPTGLLGRPEVEKV
jgi:branched-chain amino acid transport system permease protein